MPVMTILKAAVATDLKFLSGTKATELPSFTVFAVLLEGILNKINGRAYISPILNLLLLFLIRLQ